MQCPPMVLWSDDFVRELLLTQTSLTEPAILRRKGKCTWWLRASAGNGADAQQVVEEGDGPQSFWVLPSTARTVQRERGQQVEPCYAFCLKAETAKP